jgi:hypothetical protein
MRQVKIIIIGSVLNLGIITTQLQTNKSGNYE